MPTIQADRLRQCGYELFEAAGCSLEGAQAVVDHLIESDLFGHHSHGAIRFYEYARAIREGRFQPRAIPEVIIDNPCAAVVDACGALGQVGATFAMNLAVEKANQHGTGTVALRNTSHVGRVGAYPLLAARAGMIGIAFVNAGHLGYQIAPFGGIDGRLSTNPIAFSAPRQNDDPILVDMTTSVVAEGKVRLALNQKRHVPEGWLIDAEGNPTTDPKKFKGDPPGAILPLGGVVAHKGYGLSFVVELLGGILSGQGCAAGERIMVSNGVLFTVYHIEHFIGLSTYFDELEALIQHVKSSRLAPGFEEILIPGEPEFRYAQRKQNEGIEVDDTTWKSICEEARMFGLNPDQWLC
ncbi:MAG: Ldh family oxidoreductase [Candidatus Poribacteria bacterium]|nr:Ldh family oxidoreductase [Candidatus Poribacteria bacterium]